MTVFVCPKASVRSGDVSGLLSDASAKYDCDVDGSIKFTQSQTLLDQDAHVELKLPVAGLTKAVSSGKVDTSNLRGAELSVKFPAEDIKLSADVEALLSANSAPDAFKVEAGRKAEVGGRNVDLKGKYASKGHAVTLEATTRLDANTKLHASYGVRSKVLKGKLSYTCVRRAGPRSRAPSARPGGPSSGAPAPTLTLTSAPPDRDRPTSFRIAAQVRPHDARRHPQLLRQLDAARYHEEARGQRHAQAHDLQRQQGGLAHVQARPLQGGAQRAERRRQGVGLRRVRARVPLVMSRAPASPRRAVDRAGWVRVCARARGWVPRGRRR